MGMVKGRGMVNGDGEGKGDGEGMGDGQGGWSREGDGKEKGDGQGKGLPGPSSLFVGGPGPLSLSSHVYVPVMSSLGHVASSSSRVAWSCCHSASASCHRWAVSPARHHRVSGHVIIVAHPPHQRHCAVLVTSLCSVVIPA